MAGDGKESPRQLMINMMYIVLTAMLALQVSSSVIDKFTDLDKALQKSVKDYKEVEVNTIAALGKKADEFKEQKKKYAAAKALLSKAEEVKTLTAGLLKQLDDVRSGIEVATDGKKSEEEKVAEHMLDGPGTKLEKSLRSYCKDLKAKIGGSEEIPDMIAPGNKENKNFEGNPEYKNKGFTETHFTHTPMAAALATVTYMKTEVLKAESIALKELGAKIEGKKVTFDKIQATMSAPSSFVAEGDPYTAEMYVFASSSQLTTTMTVNGSPIKVVDNVGQVRIPTSAPGTRKWTGVITMTKPGGDPEVFTLNREFKVVKSDVQWINNSPPALYEGCQNDLSCIAPALGASFSPSFSGSGAVFRSGSSKGQVIIIPSVGAKKVTASVNNNGRFLNKKVFDVKPVPAAAVEIPGVNLGKGFPASKLRSIQIKLKSSDPMFTEILPKESNYQVGSWEISLIRGGNPFKKQSGSGSTAKLRSLGAVAKRGDMLSIRITRAIRINSVGQKLPAKLVSKTINVAVK